MVRRKHVHALHGQSIGFLNFIGLGDVRGRDEPHICVEKSEIFIEAPEHYCILGCVDVCFRRCQSSNLSLVQYKSTLRVEFESSTL